METFFHIAPRGDWERAQGESMYRAGSLATEGFIHCSTAGQVPWVAKMFFQGQHDLVLLEIDPSRLASEVRYETPPGLAEAFPHVYGPLNLDAVVKVEPFNSDPEAVD